MTVGSYNNGITLAGDILFGLIDTSQRVLETNVIGRKGEPSSTIVPLLNGTFSCGFIISEELSGSKLRLLKYCVSGE
jgi:hypothetical protein